VSRTRAAEIADTARKPVPTTPDTWPLVHRRARMTPS
jgi:hypothetical protein